MQKQINTLYQPLFLFIRKRIQNPQDAEDLTQEVFFKLAKSSDKELKSVKSWLYKVANHSIIDYYRKNKGATKEVEEKDLPIIDNLGKDTTHELSRCIRPFVEQLPENYRELMKMSELDEISQKEIAIRLSLNYTSVRSKIQRGRKKLKDLITSCCEVEQGRKGSIMNFYKKNACH